MALRAQEFTPVAAAPLPLASRKHLPRPSLAIGQDSKVKTTLSAT